MDMYIRNSLVSSVNQTSDVCKAYFCSIIYENAAFSSLEEYSSVACRLCFLQEFH